MSDLTITRFEPAKSLLDVKLNIISLFKYFTIWILLLDFLYLTQKIQNIEFFLIIVHVFIIIICFQVFYFKIKEFKTYTYSIDLNFKGKLLLLLDLVFHYLPFLIILFYIVRNKKKININRESIFLIIFLPVLHGICFNTKKIYHTVKKKVVLQYSLFLILVAIIIKLKFSVRK